MRLLDLVTPKEIPKGLPEVLSDSNGAVSAEPEGQTVILHCAFRKL